MKKYSSWRYSKFDTGVKMTRGHYISNSIEIREMTLFERIILRLFKRKLYKYNVCFEVKK